MTQEQVYTILIVCVLLAVCVYFIRVSNRNTSTVSGLIKSCNRDIKAKTKLYNKKLKDDFLSKVKELNNDDN